MRANQLVGYGLVIGLNGTGDSLRNSPFTEQSLQSMLDRMGVNVRKRQPRTRNVAAVIVTAELPAFIGRGSRIDVTVSSLGDATSLVGGSLIMTPLAGPDNRDLRGRSGPGRGFRLQRRRRRPKPLTQNVPTSGRIPNGAHRRARAAEPVRRRPNTRARAAQSGFRHRGARSPTRSTPIRYGRYGIRWRTSAICARSRSIKPASLGRRDSSPRSATLLVQPDSPARVVIDERTGTIVIGNDVQISTVAVAHGTLTVRVTETPQVSQPNPFSEGETAVTPQHTITADQAGGKVGHRRGAESADARRRAEPDGPQARQHHRHPPGDQDGRRAAGRFGGAMMSPVAIPANAAFASSTVGKAFSWPSPSPPA